MMRRGFSGRRFSTEPPIQEPASAPAVRTSPILQWMFDHLTIDSAATPTTDTRTIVARDVPTARLQLQALIARFPDCRETRLAKETLADLRTGPR